MYIYDISNLRVNVIWGTEFTEQTHWNIAKVRHMFLRTFSVQSYGGQDLETAEMPYCCTSS
jgi:hypothetical protein